MAASLQLVQEIPLCIDSATPSIHFLAVCPSLTFYQVRLSNLAKGKASPLGKAQTPSLVAVTWHTVQQSDTNVISYSLTHASTHGLARNSSTKGTT